jgi:hypothetical protein
LLLALALLPLLAAAAVAGAGLGWREMRKSRLAACVMLCALAPCLWAACSVDERKSAPIESKFFSRVEVIGTRGAGVGELNKPRSIALDAQDNLYVIDMTGRVQKFSPEGKYLLEWQMPQIEKGKPKGMCRDKAGDIVLVEPHYSRVNFFSPEGKLVAQFGVKGTEVGQLGMPRAAVVNSRGELYVCEYTDSERVQRFTAHGEKCLGAGRVQPRGGAWHRRARRYLCGRFLQSPHPGLYRRGPVPAPIWPGRLRAGGIQLPLRRAAGRDRLAIRVRVRQQPHPNS